MIVVPAGGPLRQLKDLTSVLELRYGWLEAEASTFVLTGGIPMLAGHAVVVHRWPWPAANSVTLQVPAWMRRQVAALYARATEEAIPRRRRRDVTAQRADLATFAFEHNDGHTWRELMDLWNRDKPQAGRFHDARTFAKACREAFLSVTGEALEWQGARHRADG